MLSKSVIKQLLDGNTKVSTGFSILINHILKKKQNNYIPQIHVHIELAQT